MNKKFAIVLALALIAIVCCAGCIDPQDPVDPVDPVVPVDPVDPVTPPVDPVVPAEEYSVFFMMNYGDAGAYTAETVKAGDAVSKPANPSRSGYNFKGWFTAAEGGVAYDFTQAVNSDLTLYAQWSKKSSSGSGSSTPSHTHSYDNYVSNNDGTHTKSCSSGDSTVTEDCKFSGYTCTLCGYETEVYHISNLTDLQNFASKVSDGSFLGKTVILDADISLAGVTWTPIITDESTFSGSTFDGNGKTISDLAVSGTEMVGFFGQLYGTVQNLNLKNVTLTGNHYLGAVAGYGKNGSIIGCTVDGVKITAIPNEKSGGGYDNGDKVGGIVGYAYCDASGHDGLLTVLNCNVLNAVITGFRDVGGIAGAAQGDAVTGNIVSNVDIIVDRATNYYSGYDAITGGEVVGRLLDTSALGQNTVNDGCTVTVILADGLTQSEDEDGNDVFTVSSGEGLVTLMEQNLLGSANVGDQALFFEENAEIDMNGQTWTPIRVDGYHGADIMTIEGNGATITGLTAPLFAGGFAGGSGIVINDLTIANSVISSTNELGIGAFVECADSMDEITLINCHLLNSKIIIDGESRVGGLVGWTAGYNNPNDGPVDSYITIEKCSVIGCELKAEGSVGGIVGHAGANAATFTTISDCIVKDNIFTSTDGGDWRVGVIVGTANNGQVEIEDITADNNTISQTGKNAPEGQSNLYGRFVPAGTGTLVIDGLYVTADVTSFKSALNSDEEIIAITLPSSGMTWETGAQHGSTPLISETNSVTEEVLIQGIAGTTDVVFTATGSGVGPIRAANDAILIFKDLTIKDESQSYAESSWEMGYLEFGGKLRFENCKFENAIMISGVSAEFVDCTFNSNNDNEYAVWIEEGDVTFTRCEFTGARGIKIHESYGSDVGNVLIDDCEFKELTKKPGVVVGNIHPEATDDCKLHTDGYCHNGNEGTHYSYTGNAIITIKNSEFIKCQPGDQSNYIYETDTPSFIINENGNIVTNN